MNAVDRLRRRIHERKRRRELAHRHHHGARARIDARAIRKLRSLLKRALILATYPRTMFDATTIDYIPPRARAVAGYVGGLFVTFPAIVVRWPRAHHVSIAVNTSESADFLDIETGDATVEDAPGWWRTHHDARGFYTGASRANSLIRILRQAGIERHEYVLWTAHWDGKHICGPHTCGEVEVDADGTQYTSNNETYDTSTLNHTFWRDLHR